MEHLMPERIRNFVVFLDQRLRNLVLDYKYSRSFLFGNVDSKYRDQGAHGAVNSPYCALEILFKDIVQDNDVIVDVGCGKGRVIGWLAKKYPSNKIIGVEIDPQIAGRTQKLFRSGTNIDIRCCNVITDFPAEGTVFYMYNPFDRKTLQAFKQKLLHHSTGVRNIRLIYHTCLYIDVFTEDPLWDIDIVNVPRIPNRSAIITSKTSSK